MALFILANGMAPVLRIECQQRQSFLCALLKKKKKNPPNFQKLEITHQLSSHYSPPLVLATSTAR